MSERLLFVQTFEGMLRVLRPELRTPEVLEALRERGLDLSRPLLPAYPHEVFVAVLPYLAQTVFPGIQLEPAITRFAARFLDAYGESMVGRAMLAMMRLIGPHRTLERLTRQFRTANNYSQTTLVQVAPREFEVWINAVTFPQWYQGLLERGLELAGAAQVSASLLSHDDEGARFRVVWSAR